MSTLFSDERLDAELTAIAAKWSPVEVTEAVAHLWPDLLSRESYPARIDDRQTSQDAAKRHANRDVAKFRRNSAAARVLIVFAIGPTPCAMTALDAARLASGENNPLSTETARKRVAELVQAGFLRDTGMTRCSAGSRDLATVWEVTAAGVRAFFNLERTGWSK